MDFKEIKNKSVEELNHSLNEWRLKLDELKFKDSQKQLKNVREIRVIKKNIAQILTLLGQKSKSSLLVDKKQK